MAKEKKIPRGIRNCNPGNIRNNSDLFQGEVVPSQDKDFKQFKNMAWGYRAMFKILRNYKMKYSRNTIAEMISKWAPKSENATERYIQFVSEKSGIGRDQIVDVSNMTVMCRLVASMSEMENGVPADMNEVMDGWNLL